MIDKLIIVKINKCYCRQLIQLFFNLRKSYIACSECKLSLSKNHMKCHFGGATGNNCDNTCQKENEDHTANESGLGEECSIEHPTFSQECTKCSMVGILN